MVITELTSYMCLKQHKFKNKLGQSLYSIKIYNSLLILFQYNLLYTNIFYDENTTITYSVQIQSIFMVYTMCIL